MTMIDSARPDVPPALVPDDAVAAGSAATTDSIRMLLEAIRLRDPSLADHGLRSAHYAAAIASELGGTAEEVDRTFVAGLLHDIGKLGVRESILWKPGALDADEWTEIRAHPVLGHRLVTGAVHDDVAATILHHHERLDGEGYPHRVRLGNLPATVRIVQVADAYDALTSDRPYAASVSHEAAMAEITRCSGTQFDPEIVDALGRILRH
jgi:HD-GYP domain-containing protein (c-di-GMP phosphodiesterase class II)